MSIYNQYAEYSPMLRCRYIIEKLKNLTPDAATKVEWINI
jgi:hypothetical protein